MSIRDEGHKKWTYPTKDYFLASNGRFFDPAPKPHNLPWGEIKQCYANAASLVIEHPRRYVYCEGLAVGVIPTEHAWVFDLKHGCMIDNTWRPTVGKAYLGVMFSFKYLRQIILERETFGPLIDYYQKDWPLLTGTHTDFLFAPVSDAQKAPARRFLDESKKIKFPQSPSVQERRQGQTEPVKGKAE